MSDNRNKPTALSPAEASEALKNSLTINELFEALSEGIIVVDAAGMIVAANRRIADMFGYAKSEVIGQSVSLFVPEQYRVVHARQTSDYFAEPRRRRMGQGIDLIGRRKDGTEFPVEISLSYIDTAVGKMGIAFVSDITKRKKTERELQVRNEELDAFAHTVAHDLNASMSLIVGYSDALAAIHQSLSPDELHNYLLLIARNGRKMSNIINELLLFASLRKEDVPLKPLDMAAVVGEAVRRLRYEIDAAEAEMIQPDSYPRVVGYPAWVEEVWFNYISNGLKYGGRPPRLELGSTVREDGSVCFWVKDNGRVLTADQQTKVFDSPSQKEMLRVQGYGLGLSIVRRIVEKLNGRVFLESQLGEGSKFGFILPAAEAQMSKPQQRGGCHDFCRSFCHCRWLGHDWAVGCLIF